MHEKFCQSCAMPLGEDLEVYGTNSDGSKSDEYCKYCFENGQFTLDCTMEEMIEICLPHMPAEMSKEQARTMMEQFMPTLKRWKLTS